LGKRERHLSVNTDIPTNPGIPWRVTGTDHLMAKFGIWDLGGGCIALQFIRGYPRSDLQACFVPRNAAVNIAHRQDRAAGWAAAVEAEQQVRPMLPIMLWPLEYAGNGISLPENKSPQNQRLANQAHNSNGR